MIKIDNQLQASDLVPKIERMWSLSAKKLDAIESTWQPGAGAPVFTVDGRYTSQGWTEWTQGFQFGSSLLQFDATGERRFLETGRENTLRYMASHVTNMGVHDHGFNNVSTYGNLLRLLNEGKTDDEANRGLYQLALKCSGAVQARRWTQLPTGGFIYSFNGPHSLFADTIRSLRSLALGHLLGHFLMEEQDKRVSQLERLVHHAAATATWSVYYGEGRDEYDVRGRVAHESIFNICGGSYRCPNSQQGFSPFTTWTRGLAWIMLGYAEQLEFLRDMPDDFAGFGGRDDVEQMMLKAARASCDFYIENTPTDGVPYWDTGAPNLHRVGDYLDKSADPYNDWEPVDSSAAAIASQGLLRLGHYLGDSGRRYWQAGLTVLNTILSEPYISTKPEHQGLILHSVYHRPNGWDHVPAGSKVPNSESSMWGDYHVREAALYVQRIADGGEYYTFFGPSGRIGERDE